MYSDAVEDRVRYIVYCKHTDKENPSSEEVTKTIDNMKQSKFLGIISEAIAQVIGEISL